MLYEQHHKSISLRPLQRKFQKDIQGNIEKVNIKEIEKSSSI